MEEGKKERIRIISTTTIKMSPPRERQPGLSLKEVVTSKPNQPTIQYLSIKKKEDEDEDEDEARYTAYL